MGKRLPALAAIVLGFASRSALADLPPSAGFVELFRVRDFPLSTADFQPVSFPQPEPDPTKVEVNPPKRKVSRDGKCSVSVSTYEGTTSLQVQSPRGDNRRPDWVNILDFRVDGQDLVVSRFGYAYAAADTKPVEFAVKADATGARTLEAEWSSGFRGDTAQLALTIDATGAITSAKAETKTLDAHLLGAIFNKLFGRNLTTAECNFAAK